jgi:hypothetical protein
LWGEGVISPESVFDWISHCLCVVGIYSGVGCLVCVTNGYTAGMYTLCKITYQSKKQIPIPNPWHEPCFAAVDVVGLPMDMVTTNGSTDGPYSKSPWHVLCIR